MTHDWMNEPELAQLPSSSLSDRAQHLENLKKLAERENQAAANPVADIPENYVTSLSALRAQRDKVSAPPAPAPVASAPVASAPVASAPVASAPVTMSEGLTRAVSTLTETTLALREGEPLSDEVINALTQLGIALNVPVVFDRLIAGFNEQRDVAPEDRFGAISLALDLRKQRISWREVTERINAAGYRNTNGDPWKLWALRRTCIRFAERKGEVIATTRGDK
jgi:hypothetical protein